MSESTQKGDSVKVTNVDSATEALLARYETEEAEQITEETPDNSTEVDTQEDQDEVTEQLDKDAKEVESEETDAIDSEQSEDEQAEDSFHTVSELAEAVGMKVEDFLDNIKMTSKVNGEDTELSLAEFKKGYQLEADYTRKNTALIEDKRVFDEQQVKAQTELSTELEKAGMAFRYAQEQITHEFHAINWTELQKSDPSQYLIKRQEFGERQARMDQAINTASQQAQELVDKQKTEKEQKDTEFLQKEHEMLLSKIPDWSDVKVRESESKQVSDVLSGFGYSAEELHKVNDHRLILMAKQIMSGVKAGNDIDIAKKKLKKAPKLLKPNARQNVNQNAKRQNSLMQKVKKTGKLSDVAAALEARMR